MNIFELFIVQPIFNLLLGIYSLVNYIPYAGFGLSVIIFTIIVRFALWPLVVKQLHQVKAMRKLQPELARIKKASKVLYGDSTKSRKTKNPKKNIEQACR